MTELNNKIALVTGGSRGLGKGIVEALSAAGARVTTIARDSEQLAMLKREVAGVQTVAADASDSQVASQLIKEVRPDILVLNAGAIPIMGPIQELSWEQFGTVWENDVKSTFNFGKEALLAPLAPGSTVVIVSSGAAFGGSPLSGSYAGAKRMQWLLAQYFQQESANLKLGIRFVTIVPKQIVGATRLGHKAVVTYAASQGISEQAFLDRFGPALTPEKVGSEVVALITGQAYQDGLAFGLSSQGLDLLN
ncbi:MAG TPA: SDR family oxidoreductase [Chloroflexia bacterium]|nr:SDR family oxidoreductase [Chloroflexia bacterium]